MIPTRQVKATFIFFCPLALACVFVLFSFFSPRASLREDTPRVLLPFLHIYLFLAILSPLFFSIWVYYTQEDMYVSPTMRTVETHGVFNFF
ncbi:hypothetical protein F5B19DRAFT_120788 [Rostrohypoxylon terebratum]|nr:hypothetical protein F5B19DRAFT_120788 [Rostrohypoxylon terebratum]